jgi:dihydroneopterin triphosphate diphosphatase
MAKLPIQVDIIIYVINNGIVKYLLFKRQPERGGFWQPVTGGVEEGETILYAARREVMEESGYIKVKNMYDLNYTFTFNVKEKIITEHVFAFEVVHTDVKFSTREHSEIKWVSFDEAMIYLKWDTNKEALTKIHNYLIKKKYLK